jgi:hypothetical protein
MLILALGCCWFSRFSIWRPAGRFGTKSLVSSLGASEPAEPPFFFPTSLPVDAMPMTRTRPANNAGRSIRGRHSWNTTPSWLSGCPRTRRAPDYHLCPAKPKTSNCKALQAFCKSLAQRMRFRTSTLSVPNAVGTHLQPRLEVNAGMGAAFLYHRPHAISSLTK